MKRTEVSVIIDYDGQVWEGIVDTMLSTSSHVIALRGAGSFNGISPADACELLSDQLIPRVESLLGDGSISFIFDGDDDDPRFPDIGHIMGTLRDRFDRRATFYAVQKLGWYRYRDTLPAPRALHSASGKEYQTVLFPDDTFAGDHDHFSQHSRLARSPNYMQWYVGACGLIASRQLVDYNRKVNGADGAHRVVIFRAGVSSEQEKKIRQKIAVSADPYKRKRLLEALQNREKNPFGLLCTSTGALIPMPELVHLQIEVI